MSWSTTYKDDSAFGKGTPTANVVSLELYGSFPGSQHGTTRLSSVTLSGYNRGIDVSSIVLGKQQLDLRSLIYSGGAWKFDYTPLNYTDRLDFCKKVVRGAILQLRTGFLGYAAADYEPRAIGVVQRVSLQGQTFTVECWDYISMLTRQPSTEASGANDFWKNSGRYAASMVTAAWTANSGSNITVDVSGLYYEKETGGNYLAYCEPTGSDPFWLKFTTHGASGADWLLSGVSATDVFDTTQANMIVGDSITYWAYMVGHPMEIMYRMIVSTGTGANGSEDIYPANWGYSLQEDAIDIADIDDWVIISDVFGGFDLDFYAAYSEQGFQYFAEVMSACAMWPCIRQGLISARSLQDLSGTPETFGIELTDKDLIQGTVVCFEDSQPYEYQTVIVAAYGRTVSPATFQNAPLTFPYEYIKMIQFYDGNYEGTIYPYLFRNIDDVGAALEARYAPWYTRIPETIQCRVKRYPWEQVCIGDIILVTSTKLLGRLSQTYTGFTGRNMMVIGLRDGFPEPWVDLDLAAPGLNNEDEYDES